MGSFIFFVMGTILTITLAVLCHTYNNIPFINVVISTSIFNGCWMIAMLPVTIISYPTEALAMNIPALAGGILPGIVAKAWQEHQRNSHSFFI